MTWLRESDEREYVQGMLALGGLVVLEIEDRESRQAVFDILQHGMNVR